MDGRTISAPLVFRRLWSRSTDLGLVLDNTDDLRVLSVFLVSYLHNVVWKHWASLRIICPCRGNDSQMLLWWQQFKNIPSLPRQPRVNLRAEDTVSQSRWNEQAGNWAIYIWTYLWLCTNYATAWYALLNGFYPWPLFPVALVPLLSGPISPVIIHTGTNMKLCSWNINSSSCWDFFLVLFYNKTCAPDLQECESTFNEKDCMFLFVCIKKGLATQRNCFYVQHMSTYVQHVWLSNLLSHLLQK